MSMRTGIRIHTITGTVMVIATDTGVTTTAITTTATIEVLPVGIPS